MALTIGTRVAFNSVSRSSGDNLGGLIYGRQGNTGSFQLYPYTLSGNVVTIGTPVAFHNVTFISGNNLGGVLHGRQQSTGITLQINSYTLSGNIFNLGSPIFLLICREHQETILVACFLLIASPTSALIFCQIIGSF